MNNNQTMTNRIHVVTAGVPDAASWTREPVAAFSTIDEADAFAKEVNAQVPEGGSIYQGGDKLTALSDRYGFDIHESTELEVFSVPFPRGGRARPKTTGYGTFAEALTSQKENKSRAALKALDALKPYPTST